MMRRLIIVALSAVSALLPGIAFAQDEAIPAISDARAYRDLLVPGDMLIPFRYSLTPATTPEDTAEGQYLFRLSYQGDAIAFNTPYPYTDGGFGEGVGSFYLTPEQTQALGWTESTGSWLDWPIAGITVELTGNPLIFSDPPSMTPRELNVGGLFSSGDFSSGSGTETNRRQLSDRVLTYAAQLQETWGIVLLTDNGRLSQQTGGAQYFTFVIPGLRQMATTAFSVQTVSPEIPVQPSGPGGFAEDVAGRFDGNIFFAGAAMAAETLDMPVMAMWLVVIGGFWMLITYKVGQRDARYVPVMLLVGIAVVVPTAAIGGLIDWRFSFILLALITASGGVTWLRRNWG